MANKKFKLSFIVIVFIIASLFTGCSNQNHKQQEEFSKFITSFFIKEVQSDTLSLNYSLAYPEKYGIVIEDVSLGSYSVESMSHSIIASENYIKKLNSFNYKLLNDEQKLTYDILKGYLDLDLSYNDFLFYSEALGPSTGIQAQLPILLAEYNFYSKKDIDNYIDLLPCVYSYFKDISEFEIEKANHNLFMSDEIADKIIDQCNMFTLDPDNNFLIIYFNRKIEEFDGLTEAEIDNYKNLNEAAVLEHVIPAYELLTQTLSSLKGRGLNNQGLSHFSKGKEYYKYLLKYKTGSNKDINDIIAMLDQTIENKTAKINTLFASDEKLIDNYINFESFPITDPKLILEDLKVKIRRDFPESIPTNCNIKSVPDSLSEYLSPAMYLVPAIDDYLDNTIYINDYKTSSQIYTTIAHEGYPGHLYQNVYFRNQNPAPIRNILNFPGYTEGWATYVELYSYHLSGINDNLAEFFEHNNLIILCMYARADIGIHYEGWDQKQAVKYIKSFGVNDNISKEIYKTLLEEPGIYLPYSVGCLEILNLRDKAEGSLKEDFNLKEFHRFLLEIGPAQFHIIETELDSWIKTQ
ncbi:MAG TPA: DUF885 domain-containing protein [Clostridiales bacterium]|nr:DUF885 domain-containing protein [Clostridiales bacterium]